MVLFVSIAGNLQVGKIIWMFDCFLGVVIVAADFFQCVKTFISSQFYAFTAVNDWLILHVDRCLRPYINSLSLTWNLEQKWK